MKTMAYEDVLAFWFSDEMAQHWFKSTPEIDADITRRYESLWVQAKEGLLDNWKQNAKGCLALIIILDQFPLNMYRGMAASFSTEANAIAIARVAIQSGFDKELTPSQCVFMYMPFMHAENLQDQDYSVTLYEGLGREENVRFAKHHHAIVEQFGRFPHRNSILGRQCTQVEIDYMNSDDAFKG